MSYQVLNGETKGPDMTKTVLITGASGKIGTHTARAFERAGWTIKRFQRGTNMAQAAQDADVIVNGMNPANYYNWAQTIPEITKAHICLLYTSPSPRDKRQSRMPSSA